MEGSEYPRLVGDKRALTGFLIRQEEASPRSPSPPSAAHPSPYGGE